MTYRVYLLDIERYTTPFVQMHLNNPTPLLQTWASNPRAWNMSYAVEAVNLEDVFHKGQMRPTWRCVSVGDVIEDDKQQCWVVLAQGFGPINRPPGACPHAATMKPENCEFCWDEQPTTDPYDEACQDGHCAHCWLCDLPF